MQAFSSAYGSRFDQDRWDSNSSLDSKESSIIDMKQYQQSQNRHQRLKNGLVDVDLVAENPQVQFAMMEASTREHKATNYPDALQGWWEDSNLSRAYFSAANVQILQNAIRAGVYRMSQDQEIVVSPQSETHLKVIMRTLYLQNARQFPQNGGRDAIPGYISKLNQAVLDFCIPFVYKEAVFHMKFLRDQSTLVVPLEHARQVDRDFKQLQGYL